MRALVGGLAMLFLTACAVQAERPLSAEEAQRAARANTDLAIYHLQEGDLARARARALRALEQDPRYVTAHLVAAEIQVALENPESAEHHYRKALRLEPENGAALNNYAGFLCHQGGTMRAIDLYELAIANRLYGGRNIARVNAGRCLADAGQPDQAVRYWRAALEHDPESVPALKGMAEVHLARGDTDTARAFFSRYTAGTAEEPAMLWLGVRIAMAEGDHEGAEQIKRKLRQRHPEFEIPHD